MEKIRGYNLCVYIYSGHYEDPVVVAQGYGKGYVGIRVYLSNGQSN